MMPHGHGIDNCSLPFCRKGRQLKLGESRFPTKIFQWNLLPASHGLECVGIYVRIHSRAVGDDCYGDDCYGDNGNGDNGEC
jgi:hypothetical protein